ncbi:hypothetical protein [Streptomyces spongiae]|uniref:Uncharacterized protein n=1 Tax=Streptomyces spongiae TaxID=565072 RepID=A0A5N8XEG1_9ACTN|nr:hypothetical protein [Streptomyces spongiae]MPY57496.1 hypothetical protein [Streptomyces spongiae]
MRRRPKGLFATLRDWWRSKYAGTTDQDGEAAGPGGDGGDGSSALPAARKEVTLQLPPQDTAVEVAARGDVFAFQVHPAFQWSSNAMTLDVLRERAAVHEGTAREELLARAWSATRECDPADPVAAERAITAKLADGWCYDDDKGRIRCSPSVRVRVDPALREHVLPYHLAELTLREEGRLGRLKAEQVESLTETWLRVIKDLEQLEQLDATQRRLLVPFAAALADQDFRKVMEALRNLRHSGTHALAKVLEDATHNHERVGMFEYANAYDKALGAFCREMGLSPFSWVDNAVAVEGPAS